MRLRSNAKIGGGFEGQLETIATQYTAKGLMRFRKVDPPTTIVGKRIIFLENPFLDFCGTWTERAGRALFFEAKSTEKDILTLDSDGGVTKRQVEALRHWHNAGAVVFVLWHNKGTVRLLTWPLIQDILTVRKHAKPSEGVIVPQGTGFVIYDFRAVMLKIF